MNKFLLFLTLFFSIESKAGESPVTEDEYNNFLVTMIVVGGVAFLLASSSKAGDNYNSSDYLYFDVENNSIIFTEKSGFKNLEINFSSQIDREIFLQNNLFRSDDFYVGFRYRF